MTQWRIFKLQCRYQHSVEDRPELVDKGCLVPHNHGFTPNPPVYFEFRIATREWVDFKTLKAKCTNVVERMVINKIDHTLIKSYPPDGLPFYDFGVVDTEHILKDIRQMLKVELAEYENVRIQIFLMETSKYGLWDDGEE